jgi:hypothetical protein
MEHLPCFPDLAPYDFWLFSKSALKGRKFQDVKDTEYITIALKAIHKRNFRNISNSGSIIGVNA